MTAGLFKPIYLEEFNDRIEELVLDVKVLPGLDLAILSVSASTTKGSEISVAILDPKGDVLITVSVLSGQRRKVTIEDPELWFSKGYRKQPLYTAIALFIRPFPGSASLATLWHKINGSRPTTFTTAPSRAMRS